MLRERITKSVNGFKVRPGHERGDDNHSIHFGTYTFRDSSDFIPETRKMKYWYPNEANEQIVDRECLVYLEEKKDGIVIDTCRFYIGRRKGRISSSIVPVKRYGRGAYKITVSWPDREPFNSDYIFLYNRQKPNEKYYFLSETVRPLDERSNKDEYIFFLTGGENAELYEVGYEPLLLEKYGQA